MAIPHDNPHRAGPGPLLKERPSARKPIVRGPVAAAFSVLDPSPGDDVADLRAAFRAFERSLETKPALTDDQAGCEPAAATAIEALLRSARLARAAQVTLEPSGTASVVAFLIDGVRHDITRCGRRVQAAVVARLKARGKVCTGERCVAQGGRIAVAVGGEEASARLGVVPMPDGEKAVLEFLSPRDGSFTLQDAGMSRDDATKALSAMRQRPGLILAAGPVGSGRAVTLRAMLGASAKDVTAIQDPFGRDLPGFGQVETDAGAGVTVASALEAVVRQRPAAVLLGELREEAAAAAAIRAASTGQRVLAAIRADDAASALARLVALGIAPADVASAVRVAVAQRLVRTVCASCAKDAELSRAEARAAGLPEAALPALFGDAERIMVRVGGKCAACRFTGFVGRLGVFEVLEMGLAVTAAVAGGADASVIRREALRQGMTTLLQDGLAKVRDGRTTLPELLRVLRA